MFHTIKKNIGKEYSFFAIKDFKFLDVTTQHKTQGKALGHGYYDGQVQIIQRPIKLTLGAFAHSRQERLEKIKQLEKIFSVPSSSGLDEVGYHQLSFEEPNGKKREMEVKVIERNRYDNYDNESRVGIRVKLLVKNDSSMFSNKYTLTDQNRIMGMNLANTLSFPFWYPNAQEVHYQGVSGASVDVTITALADNPCDNDLLIRCLRNNGTHTLLWLQGVILQQGDIIKIDSVAGKIERNGFDITGAIKLPFYEFPVLENLDIGVNQTGNNILVVDCGLPSHVLDVVWEWRDVWG